MKYSVLNKSEDIARSELKKHKSICISCLILALIVNAIFVLCSNEDTFTLFLVLNIVVDIAAGVFIYTYYLVNIDVQKKLVAILGKGREEISGIVEHIGENTSTYLGIECLEVEFSGRTLFLPNNSIELVLGEKITVFCSSNVIVEVEKC